MPSWAKQMQSQLDELKTKLAGDPKPTGTPQVIPKPEPQPKPEDKPPESTSSGEKKTGFLDWLLG